MDRSASPWVVDYEGSGFERFFTKLGGYEQAVLVAAIEHVLKIHGIDVCQGEWGKPLKDGLYEFRVRRSLKAILREAAVEPPNDLSGIDRMVLIRVFCTFHGERIVLLYSGYDKGKDPSEKRQEREIARARKLHRAWKRRA